MKNKQVGFEIRTLSNLIHRRINQMVAEEEETLTASQAWEVSGAAGGEPGCAAGY